MRLRYIHLTIFLNKNKISIIELMNKKEECLIRKDQLIVIYKHKLM
jgi:hypothetical protein